MRITCRPTKFSDFPFLIHLLMGQEFFFNKFTKRVFKGYVDLLFSGHLNWFTIFVMWIDFFLHNKTIVLHEKLRDRNKHKTVYGVVCLLTLDFNKVALCVMSV